MSRSTSAGRLSAVPVTLALDLVAPPGTVRTEAVSTSCSGVPTTPPSTSRPAPSPRATFTAASGERSLAPK